MLVILAAFGMLAADRGGPARNAILFVGDGMGVPVLTAARIHAHGPRGRLALELPHTALVRTHSLDRMVSDSAATATALLSGVKVASGVIGMSESTRRSCSRVTRENDTPNPVYPCAADARAVHSLADLAIAAGMAVGLVTTTRVTHATPAALYAHIDDRDFEEDIASQLVERADLAFVAGGGRDKFDPFRVPEVGESAGRADGRDLWEELREAGYAVASSGAELREAVTAESERVVALLAPGHLPFELERRAAGEDLPALEELVRLAIRMLSRHPGGYLLLVEGGRIDHALHANLGQLALVDTLAFDDAVAAGLRNTSEENTLIVVTADHGHPLVIAGYALVDDPILGLARRVSGIERRDQDRDGKPDHARGSDGKGLTILQFGNGPGHGNASAEKPHAVPREDPLALGDGLNAPRYMQESAVPLKFSTHEGSDVVASARGPGAERVRGFVDNTEIYGVVRDALGLEEPKAEPERGRSSPRSTSRSSARARSAAKPMR